MEEMVPLERLFGEYPSVEGLLATFSADDRAELRSVDADGGALCQPSLYSDGAVDRIYARYFRQVGSFVDVLRLTGAVVTGKAAFEFFTKVNCCDELHVIVCETTVQHLKWFLTKSEGYYLDKTVTLSQAQVLNLRYTLHEKVVVISVTEARNPYETFLRHSCVTSELNFLSADFGYCLFPKRTIVRKESQVCKPNALEREEEEGLRKISEFGFRVIPWGERQQDEELSSKRMIGDDLTWTVQLNICLQIQAIFDTGMRHSVDK
ncbi:uncharacterized protein N7446_003980 [Penicillium canescens]|uniref:Uncharacterized protein n=1 Tax=Penicillium canescens TaxID=5083 RepID=A0AAD6I1W1_PENCN|nr:uncharacterized protein N7446_003980 [Penicillium canescens]KAJ6027426.1 hypothetical protein N7460_012243 [Penicillium canescens]KAJ6040704.1 hypothetical protein N7444_009609 [Penicillium canescens]KAJ6066943.1 hypothetical protein N7446_003980 [Penicillium canescens]